MILVNELLWKPDTAIDEIRKREGWSEFHREAGRRGFHFDLIVKDGRRYKCNAFTVSRTSLGGWVPNLLAEGDGKTPFEAVEKAYRATGRADDVLDRLWSRIGGEVVVQSQGRVAVADDLDALFDDERPAADADEFEDIFN